MKTITTNFTDYKQILEAERVTVHHLIQHFKKDQIDYDAHGNIFIGFSKETKGLPILVAHTDNVLHGTRCPIFDLNKRILSGKNTGIGFDDKAGIIAIAQLWKAFKKKQMFRIIFTADEEIGGVGAEKIDPSMYEDATYIIELDRKGGNDLIQTSGSTKLCSDAFASKFEELGFEKATGTFTDVNKFKLKAKSVNMCNLSIGYYSPHTDDEYLDTKEFDEIVNAVAGFIEQEYVFDPDVYVEYNWNYGRDYYSGRGGWLDKEPDYCWCCGKQTFNKPDSDGAVFCGNDCRKEYRQIMKEENK